jgi:alpha-glucosidase
MLRIIAMVFILHLNSSNAQQFTVHSPENILSVKFELIDGKAYYSVQRFGIPVVESSQLGFILRSGPHFDADFTILNAAENNFDETWTQSWGEVKDIRNNYKELIVSLAAESSPKRFLNIIFRVYDYGIGFRYEIPRQEGLNNFEIMDELSEFNFSGNHSSWWIKAFQWNRYEYLYQNSELQEVDTVHTPFTMETKDGIFISVHEAALTDYSSMALKRTEQNNFKAELFPWSDGAKVKAGSELISPWRTIQIADNPGSLITDYLILNLNEPNKLGNVSWVKPGKYVGIWWEMHIGKASWGSGDIHGATTSNAKKYIDFASKYGFDGVLIEGWNLGWDGDWIANGDIFNFTTPYPDFDILEVTRYAEEKNVKIIGHHETGGSVLNYESQLEAALDYYENLGINIIKTGYVNFERGIKRLDEKGDTVGEWHHGQFMVRHYRKVVEEAAKRKIMINVHEPIKPTGIRRTYPNMMTREGARGQEYDAWDEQGGNPPDHTVIIPFTRLLGGPMDFTPGIFDLNSFSEKNRVNTTLARQLAHYVTLYSPLHMAADLPENYEARPEPFKFIVEVPTDWENTIVLNASIGNYLTIVRKDRLSENWYLGSTTDEIGRTFDFPLYFLTPGKEYSAEIYKDGENADWKNNPYSIEITKLKVNSNTILNVKLAPGGGTAIKFTPLG